MQLKQYLLYQMDFKGKWAQPAAILMGLSFFLRIVCYFGLRFLSDWTFFDVIFQIFLPLLLSGTYVVLIRAIRLNAPGVYGLIGAGLCILTFLWSFSSGSVLYILLCLVYYLAAGVVLLGTSGGYLPGKLLSSALFAIPVIIRLFGLDVFTLKIDGLFLELSVLLQLASLFCLTRCFKEAKRRAEPAQKRK